MKHGIFKRTITFCMIGAMSFALIACGDSGDRDEEQEIIQDTVQESEEELIEAAENEEVANAVNSSENIVSVAHVSSSGNNGNGTTTPIFKPGSEIKPGEEPQQPQRPQSNTGTQSAHTHNWVTQTIYHDATGHYESRVTGTEQELIGFTSAKTEYVCDCGYSSDSLGGWESHSSDELWKQLLEWEATGKPRSGLHEHFETVQSGGDPIYETRDIVEKIWVVDSAAWDETVTTCSFCGARQ